jgi:hypothetical protein
MPGMTYHRCSWLRVVISGAVGRIRVDYLAPARHTSLSLLAGLLSFELAAVVRGCPINR